MLSIHQWTRNPNATERRILTALAGGASGPEAALACGITAHAVRAHTQRMRDRYAPTNCSLIALAVKLGWIAVPVWVPRDEPEARPEVSTFQMGTSPPHRENQWTPACPAATKGHAEQGGQKSLCLP